MYIDMWLFDDVILVELLDTDFWDINVLEKNLHFA